MFCGNDGGCYTPVSCDGGTACDQCTDFVSCVACNQIAYVEGWAAFNALTTCVTCKACYNVCLAEYVPAWDGIGPLCTSPPSTPGVCDIGACILEGGTCSAPCDGVDGCLCAACDTCTIDGGSCSDLQAACDKIPDCVKLTTIIPQCPAFVPDAGKPSSSSSASSSSGSTSSSSSISGSSSSTASSSSSTSGSSSSSGGGGSGGAQGMGGAPSSSSSH
jgi:hypothetical protein